MGEVDCQIAAIAIANNAQLATRDGNFADCGVEIINPWARLFSNSRCGFRVDRIKALSDGETSEVVDPANIADWLTKRAGMR